MKLNTTILKTTLLAAVIGISTLPAQASDGYGRGHNNSSYGQRASYAGEITIDGYTTRIRSDRHIATNIARAFRRAGYYAHTRNGRVVVDYADCPRPRVRWYADGYSLQMRWGYDSVSFTYDHRYAPSYRPRHRGRRHAPRRVRQWGYHR
ncbi:MAG: hypothetical protein JKY96_08965 [Phycisphaerales bacterium]|nr:hypothetical protein [Phycisphaerales bacterium]